MADQFKEADYLAFLAYAGTPPDMEPSRGKTGAHQLIARLDYTNQCDEFCAEYFGQGMKPDGVIIVNWLGFYSCFLTWYECQRAINNETFSLNKEKDND